MPVRKLFVTMVNQDGTEGRGPMLPRGYFTTLKEATRFGDSQESYGFPEQMAKAEEATVYEKAEDHPKFSQRMYDKVQATRHKRLIESATTEEKVKALKKLTAREKQILGLTVE